MSYYFFRFTNCKNCNKFYEIISKGTNISLVYRVSLNCPYIWSSVAIVRDVSFVRGMWGGEVEGKKGKKCGYKKKTKKELEIWQFCRSWERSIRELQLREYRWNCVNFCGVSEVWLRVQETLSIGLNGANDIRTREECNFRTFVCE